MPLSVLQSFASDLFIHRGLRLKLVKQVFYFPFHPCIASLWKRQDQGEQNELGAVLGTCCVRAATSGVTTATSAVTTIYFQERVGTGRGGGL